jgi:hypothetical protein
MKKINITLPTLHSGQVKIYQERSQRDVICCGRRFGKTQDMVVKAAMVALRGGKSGIFTPEYKQGAEPFDQLRDLLHPIIKSASRTEGTIKLKTGGKIDFWTTTDNYLCGRGREYHHVFVDEAAFTKSTDRQMLEIWEKSIEPTLLTTNGKVTVYSTPNGINEDNFFYQCWHDPKLGFKRHHAPTSANPYVKPEYLERKRLTMVPQVFLQEHLAEFVSWAGIAFFSLDKLTVNNKGVDYPMNNDYVFATIDSAMKIGQEHDATAVVYGGVSKHFGHPLTILDYDIVQIESDLLTDWLPNIFKRLEQLALETKSRGGVGGVWIEDKSSGTTLLQSALRRGWDVQAIDGKIVAAGKDGRAIAASGAVHQGEVKLSQYAFDKVVTYKGNTRNALISQVTNFRIGDKDAGKRSDDLLDAFVYNVICSLGGQDVF